MRIVAAASFVAAVLLASGCGASTGPGPPPRTASPPTRTAAPAVVPVRQVWHRQGQEQLPKEDSLLAADFVDLKHGWVVGGPVEATTDGGGCWAPQMTGMWQSFRGASFVDRTHGWLVGNAGAIAVTRDGSSWDPQPSDTKADLWSAAFVD
ncbi:MAG TPA: hypothetical protein VK576_05310, partial [Thermoleophilia bacterium]|nr:hypothetical protein [Thermoleophilia bacterium]